MECAGDMIFPDGTSAIFVVHDALTSLKRISYCQENIMVYKGSIDEWPYWMKFWGKYKIVNELTEEEEKQRKKREEKQEWILTNLILLLTWIIYPIWK